jgi:hypothetical protein
MCGYACIGCGNCGKPKSKFFDVAAVCPKCQIEIPKGTYQCIQCGFSMRPGVPISKLNQNLKTNQLA